MTILLSVMPAGAGSQTTPIRLVPKPAAERTTAAQPARPLLTHEADRLSGSNSAATARLPDSEHQMRELLRALDREAASGRLSLEEYRERLRQIVGQP